MRQLRIGGLALMVALLAAWGSAARAHVEPPDGEQTLRWRAVMKLVVVFNEGDMATAPEPVRLIARGPALIVQNPPAEPGGPIPLELVAMELVGESPLGPIEIHEQEDPISEGFVRPREGEGEPGASGLGIFLTLAIGERRLHVREPLRLVTRPRHWSPVLINYHSVRSEGDEPEPLGLPLFNGEGDVVGQIVQAEFGRPAAGRTAFEEVEGGIQIRFRRNRDESTSEPGDNVITDALVGSVAFEHGDPRGRRVRVSLHGRLEMGGADAVGGVVSLRRLRGNVKETHPNVRPAAVATVAGHFRIRLADGRLLQTKHKVTLVANFGHPPVRGLVFRKRGGRVPLFLVPAEDGTAEPWRRRVVAYLTRFSFRLSGNALQTALGEED